MAITPISTKAASTTAVKVSNLTEARTISKDSLFLLTNNQASNKLTYTALSIQLNKDLNAGVNVVQLVDNVGKIETAVITHTTQITNLSSTTSDLGKNILYLSDKTDELSTNVFGTAGLKKTVDDNSNSITSINSKIGTTDITGTITENIYQNNIDISELKILSGAIPTATTCGPIKVGFITSESEKNYAVKVDTDGNAFVYVPGSGGGGGEEDWRVTLLASISSYYAEYKSDGSIKNIVENNTDRISTNESSINTLNSNVESLLMLYNNIALYEIKSPTDIKLSGGYIYDLSNYCINISDEVSKCELSVNGLSVEVDRISAELSTELNRCELSVNSISAEVLKMKDDKIGSIFEFKEYSTTETTIPAGDVLTVRIVNIKIDKYIPMSIGKITTTGTNSENVAINSRWIDNNETAGVLRVCFAVENVGTTEATLKITAQIIFLKTAT